MSVEMHAHGLDLESLSFEFPYFVYALDNDMCITEILNARYIAPG
jgi:hypothetical protein